MDQKYIQCEIAKYAANIYRNVSINSDMSDNIIVNKYIFKY